MTAALLDALAVGDAFVDQAGLEGQRATDGVSGVHGVVGLGHHLNEELLLGLEGVVELLEGGHLQNVHGLGADLLALVHTRGENKLQGTNHVEEGGVVPAVGLVAGGGLHATDDAVAAGILQGVAAGHHGGDDHLVVVEGGNAHTLAGDGGGLDEQGVGRAVPDTDGQGGLGQTDVHLGLHAHVGQIVGGVQTVLVLTAHDEVLEQAVTGEALGGGGVTDLVQIVELDPDAVKQLLGGLVGDLTGIQISLEEGVHILVEAAGGDGVTRGLHLHELLDEPEALACLVEGAGGLGGDAVAGLGDGQQLGLAVGVGAVGGLGQSQIRVAAGVGDDTLTALDDGLQEVAAGGVVALTAGELGQLCLALLDVGLQTLVDDPLVVDVDVAHAVVEVVTDRENAVVQEDVQNLGVHVGGGEIADGLALPVGVNRLQTADGVGGDVEGIGLTGGDGLVLGREPLEGELGEGLTAAGSHRAGAHDQLTGTDDDRNILQNMTEGGRTALDDGQMLGLLVALGNQLRAIGLDLGHVGVEILNQAGNTGAFFNDELDLGHGSTLSYLSIFYEKFGVGEVNGEVNLLVHSFKWEIIPALKVLGIPKGLFQKSLRRVQGRALPGPGQSPGYSCSQSSL